MGQPVITLPKVVVRATPSHTQRTCFVTNGIQQRLEYKEVYRKERLKVLTSRRHKRLSGRSFDEAARDAENQLQLFELILAQLARQENAWLKQNGIGDEREKMRSEAVEVLQTVL
jgi:hypothetical protein